MSTNMYNIPGTPMYITGATIVEMMGERLKSFGCNRHSDYIGESPVSSKTKCILRNIEDHYGKTVCTNVVTDDPQAVALFETIKQVEYIL